MSPRIWIEQLTFSDGSTVQLGKNDIVVIVGPNNAGKSAALRAIRDNLSSGNKSPVVADLNIGKTGSEDDVVKWLDTFTRKNNPLASNPVFQAFGIGINSNHARSLWKHGGTQLNELSRFFCQLLTVDERLRAANPAPNIALLRDPPSHPTHYIMRDDQLEQRLSKQFRKAFGLDLVVNRSAGNQIPLHVGQRPTPPPGKDRLSNEYVEALEQLPLLHEQGDGMRSYAGVLLHTAVGRESILLVDEPEAFLHPPQARQLGRMLVSDKPDSRQMFVATHSGDVLRGVLDAGSANVRVVRLRRVDNVNHIRQLDNAKIAELWNDPLLRYSNILDGLFHEKVVVCEGDSDARFYAAVMDAVVESQGADAKRPDVMFTHCGGKARLAVVVRALREVDVPVVAVADFDILNEQNSLKGLVEAAGGNWAELQDDWNEVKNTIDKRKPDLSTTEVVDQIEKVLKGIKAPAFPDSATEAIRHILKRSSPWTIAKDVGKPFVPAGQPRQVYERLSAALKKLGIFIVEVGEVERFVPTVGGHGPVWVNEALKKDLGKDPELDAARKFVREMLG